jgi:hypothetical protein
MSCPFSLFARPSHYLLFIVTAALSEESSYPCRRCSEASAQTGLVLLDQSPTTYLSVHLNGHAVIRQAPLTTTLQPVRPVSLNQSFFPR